ncbi:hypothetical protein FACS1894120_1500 [Clostridia bacterium]|nr:hypothetical protein FACS1894120_1500 [Clostridia bacterium]
MAIERMSLLLIEGHAKYVDEALLRCCESGIFHITQPSNSAFLKAKGETYTSLSGAGVYRPLLSRAAAVADMFGFKNNSPDYMQLELSEPSEFDEFLTSVEERLFKLRERQGELTSLHEQHTKVLGNIEQLLKLNSNLDDLFSLEYNRVRFGRLPIDGYHKLSLFENRNFVFFPYQDDGNYVWGMYMTSLFDSPDIDELFASIYFERIRLPDYIHGTPSEAREQLNSLIKSEAKELDDVKSDIDALKAKVETRLGRVMSKLRMLNESDELRSNVILSGSMFFLEGFVPSKEKRKFIEYLEAEIQPLTLRGTARNRHASQPDTDVPETVAETESRENPPQTEYNVVVGEMPVGSGIAKPPVRLRNNALFRPFEMFVNMYGLPEYDSIDCTPFVAITYTLIYGIMFGDLGQGLMICAIGFLLAHWKKIRLGEIMVRIGLSGAFFGTLYGSVFGNEELIRPFFQAPGFYKMIGAGAPPESLFNISSVLLVSSLALGIFLIIFSMILNIIIGFKQKDLVSALLSPSGVNGFILYTAVIAGLGLKFVGVDIMNTAYIVILIILPLCVQFFHKPIIGLVEKARKKAHGDRVSKDTELSAAIDRSAECITKGIAANTGGTYTYSDFLDSPFVNLRYGSFLYENYEILRNYTGMSRFFFFPLRIDSDRVTGVYIVAKEMTVEVDSLFESLGFTIAPMPDRPEGFVDGTAVPAVPESEAAGKHVKKSAGIFLIESVIDVFENSLSYLANTVSFLRVAGFVMSHAGMMMVVRVLSSGAGKGAIIVEIFGNLFVIGMEGFLVGIQVLRLEFYEMFCRFYKSGGKPFTPVNVSQNK